MKKILSVILLLTICFSAVACKPTEPTSMVEPTSMAEPKTKTISESYDIIYQWLIENGTLNKGTELSYVYKNGDTTVCVSYDSAMVSEDTISFYMTFPSWDDKTLFLTYYISKNDNDKNNYYIVRMESNLNRAYASQTYSLSLDSFTPNSPTKYETGRNSNTDKTFNFEYTEQEKEDGKTMSSLLSNTHYDCFILFLSWLDEKFCCDTGLTMKDLGYLKYK